MLIYTGDWKKTAVAYRDWFSKTFKPIKHPEWVRQMDGHLGQWFHKRGQMTSPNHNKASKSLMNPMNSFKELPDVYRRLPVDTIEFAFHCRGSMEKNLSGKEFFTHTDGDNVIREDLGGALALREGVNLVHRLGFHFTLYIEGYICPDDSDIVIKGKVKEWIVINKDGSNAGNYSKKFSRKNWLHMCPGAKGWQNHLAKTAARLVRETGADGIRLDSLGCHFFPCYNPLHKHKSPFDFNIWMRELLEKVARAVRKVNPNCVLLTEAGADFYNRYFDLGGASKKQFEGHLYAPGIGWSKADGKGLKVNIPGTVKLTIPTTLPEGKYPIKLYSTQFFGCKRFVEIKRDLTSHLPPAHSRSFSLPH